jgi:HEAT repeats
MKPRKKPKRADHSGSTFDSVLCRTMKSLPKVIPPRSRVRLVRSDKRTPTWRKDVGREFRVGYYSRQDGLDCIWLVNEDGKYEQTTDREFLLKYFEVERLSEERNFYGRGKRRLGKIRVRTPLERLNGSTSTEVYEAAKEIWEKDDPDTIRSVIRILHHGQRPMNRVASAYALSLMHGKAAIRALERSLDNKQEHPRVRGQAAESLAHNHREETHHLLRRSLVDLSKDVRFWCAYSLSEMGDEESLTPLKNLAEKDHRIVRGFWAVSKEARAAIRKIQREIRERKPRNRKACLFCSKPAGRGAFLPNHSSKRARAPE